MIKPGYRTSEFWFTLVSFIFSGFYLIGLFGEDAQQKEDLIRDVSHGVESIILISGQMALLWKYVNSRKEIKKTWWSTASEEERIEASKRLSKSKISSAESENQTKPKTVKKKTKPKPKK
jgi:hypothetical protein